MVALVVLSLPSSCCRHCSTLLHMPCMPPGGYQLTSAILPRFLLSGHLCSLRRGQPGPPRDHPAPQGGAELLPEPRLVLGEFVTCMGTMHARSVRYGCHSHVLMYWGTILLISEGGLSASGSSFSRALHQLYIEIPLGCLITETVGEGAHSSKCCDIGTPASPNF